jgi:threonine dehydratase
MKPPVTYEDVLAAADRIAGGVAVTPCPASVPLGEAVGCRIHCKLDYHQRTGSFKERGVRNKLMLMSDRQRAAGVIAASAGNHALGLSYHGKLLGAPVTVVMPRFAPIIKSAACRRLGARVVLHGESFAEAQAYARKLEADEGLTYVHGFDDPAVIAGQGTAGLEILRQVPDLDAVIVPIGGGGLLAGVALAVKAQRPEVQVIGVEAAAAPTYTEARKAGKPVPIVCGPTLADGLAVPMIGANAFAVAEPLVDQIVTVAEDDIALAILRLAELEKGVVEGAGAAPLAALLGEHLPGLAGKRVVLLLCGGNIDMNILARVIEKGLAADGRLCRFTARSSDRPGGLAALASVIAAAGASIREVFHDRAFSGPDVSAVHIVCTVETRDRDHVRELMDRLAAAGIQVVG